MATHSSVLAWRIPGTADPGGLPSLGSQSWTRLKQLDMCAHSVYVSIQLFQFIPTYFLPLVSIRLFSLSYINTYVWNLEKWYR